MNTKIMARQSRKSKKYMVLKELKTRRDTVNFSIEVSQGNMKSPYDLTTPTLCIF